MKFKSIFLFSFVFLCRVVNSEENLENVNLDSYLNQKGFFLSPVHSQKNEGYTSAIQRKEFFKSLQNVPQINKIMEIGFNAGHSSEAFLNATSCNKLLSIDINVHPYTATGVEFIKQKFGERFEFIAGDSRLEVPKYAAAHPNEKFDLIFIDGGHAFECTVSDIRNCRQLAHHDTILWIDDYAPWGVKAAVDFCVQEGVIALVTAQSVTDLSDGIRAWAIARYQSESEKAFSHIYHHGLWGKDRQGCGISGPGSTLGQGKPSIEFLQNFLDTTPGITSVVDIGCGDWVLAREIDWGDRDYTGIDVVDPLIARNQSLFGSEKIHFILMDVTSTNLPSGDLAICKDVLMHLPNSLVFNVLSKLKKFKYSILIHDVDSATKQIPNRDTVVGGFRPLDLTAAPFFLKPLMVGYYFSGAALKQVLVVENGG